jgi:hypothetical protein
MPGPYTERKRLKKTSSKAKISRVPFGNDAIKVLGIPTAAFEYNYSMLMNSISSLAKRADYAKFEGVDLKPSSTGYL